MYTVYMSTGIYKNSNFGLFVIRFYFRAFSFSCCARRSSRSSAPSLGILALRNLLRITKALAFALEDSVKRPTRSVEYPRANWSRGNSSDICQFHKIISDLNKFTLYLVDTTGEGSPFCLFYFLWRLLSREWVRVCHKLK